MKLTCYYRYLGFLMCIFAFAISPNLGFSQNNKLKAVDSIYLPSIHTVLMSVGGTPLSVPTVGLSGGSFKLSFDDTEADLKNFMYSLELYDRDWKNPVKLDRMEYTEGYQEDRILNPVNSSATNIQYLHYDLMMPNENMRFSKSGNYILKVFLDDGEKTPVLTRRFIVYESVLAPVVTPAIPNPINYNTHHELDIAIEPKNFRIQNPMNEIQLSIIQNQRWDVAKNNVKPLYVQGEKLIFDYQDSILFLAGKEWRYVDLRSTRFRSERVNKIDQDDETWLYTLRPDLDRAREPYLIYPDLNGGYFVESNDFNNTAESSYKADYVDVIFSLIQKQPREDEDVYIYGALTDWKIDERFKMEYDAAKKIYEATVQIKQGFYNYIYVTVPKNTKTYDASALEGDWFETQNEYTVLVYYRPFGGRYDRVIGLTKYISNKKQ